MGDNKRRGRRGPSLIHDEVWNFLGKNRYSTTVVKGGLSRMVYFHDLNPDLEDPDEYEYDDRGDYFSIDDCYDDEGYFDYDKLEDAIMDGEYVPEDW